MIKQNWFYICFSIHIFSKSNIMVYLCVCEMWKVSINTNLKEIIYIKDSKQRSYSNLQQTKYFKNVSLSSILNYYYNPLALRFLCAQSLLEWHLRNEISIQHASQFNAYMKLYANNGDECYDEWRMMFMINEHVEVDTMVVIYMILYMILHILKCKL